MKRKKKYIEREELEDIKYIKTSYLREHSNTRGKNIYIYTPGKYQSE